MTLLILMLSTLAPLLLCCAIEPWISYAKAHRRRRLSDACLDRLLRTTPVGP